MAGHDATAQRAAGDALALEQWIFSALRDSRGHRWIPDRWRDLSLAVRREHLYSYAGDAGDLSVECAGCGRTAAHRDSLRRSGAFPRAQASVSRDLWTRGVSRAGLHDSLRQ